MSNLQLIHAVVGVLANLLDSDGCPLFEAVNGPSDDRRWADQFQYQRAQVTPLTFACSDKILAGKIVATITYEVEVTTLLSFGPSEDPNAVIDALISLVMTALNGADLGDGTLPQLARVTGGRYFQYGRKASRLDPSPTRNERRLWLDGQCAYILN